MDEHEQKQVCLPNVGWRKSKKLYIKDEALLTICREQRQAKKRWTINAGKPRGGSLYQQQKNLKKQVGRYVRDVRGAEERWRSQDDGLRTPQRFHHLFRCC